MDELRKWHSDNGGFLHPQCRLDRSDARGCYLEAIDDLPDGTTIVTVPHTMALSCLNAMVDESLPVLKANAESFTVEALGVFFLMAQWINRETSFYKPFLNILQTPEEGFNTPHWFDDEDTKYLRGTDLENSFQSRKEIWHKYWRDGTAILASDGMDVSQYTWDLCKWAATVFTSRSLSSRALRPYDSSYWTAYRQGPNGRQTVLLDLSNVPEERKDFPVLIPVMDCLNHHHSAHVDWRFDPGRFELSLAQDLVGGAEVLNNYGPKSNSELLLGYGFCVENNPYDCSYQALRPPPPHMQAVLRQSHAGYFNTNGSWNSDATVFKLTRWDRQSGQTIWSSIPPALVEMFYYIVQSNRGLPVIPINFSLEYFFGSGLGRRYLPSIATMMLSSLPSKYQRILQSDEALPAQPQNDKQRYAKVYRDGQRDILRSLQGGFVAYLQCLRIANGTPPSSQPGDLLIAEDAVSALELYGEGAAKCFADGAQTALGSDDLMNLEGEAAFNFWVLWLLYATVLHLSLTDDEEAAVSNTPAGTGVLSKWLLTLQNEYPRFPSMEDGECEDEPEMDEWRTMLERAVTGTREKAYGELQNPWTSATWSAKLVLDFGVRVAASQTVVAQLDEATGLQTYLYLHRDDEADEKDMLEHWNVAGDD